MVLAITHVLEPGDALFDEVSRITSKRMCECVVEATGVPTVAERAGTLAGKNGELLLFGQSSWKISDRSCTVS